MSLKTRSLLLFGALLMTALGSTSYALPLMTENPSELAGSEPAVAPSNAQVLPALSSINDEDAEPDSLQIQMTSDQWDKYIAEVGVDPDEGQVILAKGKKHGSRAAVACNMHSPKPKSCQTFTGGASYYANSFNGGHTSSGQTFSNGLMTAAHRTLPCGTIITVTNQTNGKKVRVIVNDRGPFVKGRIVDLTKKAAEELGMVKAGHAAVVVSTCG